MERPASKQRMEWPRLTRLLKLIQFGQQQSRVGDRIDSKIVAASVGRSAAERDVHPSKAAVRGAIRQPRRLGDDGGFGADAGSKQRAGAEALPLFVDDGGDEKLPPGSCSYSGHCRGADCRESTLHVGRAPAVNAVIAHVGGERLVNHTLDSNDIEVAVQHESGCVTRAEARNDVWPARRSVGQLDGEAPVVENRSECACALTLTG